MPNYRVVRAPGHVAQRSTVLQPQYPAYESAARAELGSMAAQGQGLQGVVNQLSSGGDFGVGPSGAGDAEQAALTALGVSTPSFLGTHKNRWGITVPNMFNPAGPGTPASAYLQGTGAGRLVAQQIAAQHPGPGGGTYSSVFGPGTRFYGRGTAEQWAADSNTGTGGHERFWAEAKAHVHALIAAWVVLAAGEAALIRSVVSDFKASANKAAKNDEKVFVWEEEDEYPVGPGGPVSPSPNAGYYPIGPGGPAQSGTGKPTTVYRLALAEAIKRMGQQAHEPASSSGGAGGTSMAPARLVLHGMKHPYDWIAGLR